MSKLQKAMPSFVSGDATVSHPHFGSCKGQRKAVREGIQGINQSFSGSYFLSQIIIFFLILCKNLVIWEQNFTVRSCFRRPNPITG